LRGTADKTGEVERAQEQISEVLDEIELQRNLLALSAALRAANAAAPEERMALVAAELQQLAETAKGKHRQQQAETDAS
jgi:methyl-accepting chemotaxis protein